MCKAVEARGYDIDEIDSENAADAARAAELGLAYDKGTRER